MTNRNYRDPLYKAWRKKVYARDKHHCRWPGCTSKRRLQAHHIFKWSEFPGLRFHPHNGITLCKAHHDMIHNNEDAYRDFFMRIVQNGNG
jgi:predicted restriction endonuclease